MKRPLRAVCRLTHLKSGLPQQDFASSTLFINSVTLDTEDFTTWSVSVLQCIIERDLFPIPLRRYMLSMLEYGDLQYQLYMCWPIHCCRLVWWNACNAVLLSTLSVVLCASCRVALMTATLPTHSVQPNILSPCPGCSIYQHLLTKLH